MPDLATHALSVYFARYVRGIRRYFAPLLVGSVLPDLGRSGATVLFPQYYWAWSALHTPLVLLAVCYALAMLFVREVRRGAFVAMYAGCIAHLALDLMQRHIGDASYFWGFPFTWKSFELGWFWPETSLAVMPFLVAGAGTFELVRWRVRRAR